MNDGLRERYEETPYRQGAFPVTHPARTGAIARIFGLAPAPPDRCRVLELGCGEANNFLPLAERFPRSRFTGVDFSAAEIATAETARAAAALDHVELICADFRDYEPEPAAFDYIIVHGIYSWVPDDVKARLLALCARALAPSGVALVSYNTYPAWKTRGMLRELLLREIAGETTAPARLARAEKYLRELQQGLADRKDAYALLLLQEIEGRLKKDRIVIYHDELAAINDPCWFHEFAERAAAHRLRYLGDARLASMFAQNLTPASRASAAQYSSDQVRMEQHLDILRNRAFRSTLLVHEGLTIRPTPDPEAMRECLVQTTPRLSSAGVDLAPGVSGRFEGGKEFTVQSDKPLIKAAYLVLSRTWPRRIPYAELLAAASQLVQAAGLPAPTPEHEDGVLRTLLEAFIRGLLDAMLAGETGGEWSKSAPAPAISALTRHYAANELPLANFWHELVNVPAADREWLARWQGALSVDDHARRDRLSKLGLLW